MTKFLPYIGGSHANGRTVGLTESMFRAGLRNQDRYYQPENVELVRVVIVPKEKLSEEEQKAISWDDNQQMQFDNEGSET